MLFLLGSGKDDIVTQQTFNSELLEVFPTVNKMKGPLFRRVQMTTGDDPQNSLTNESSFLQRQGIMLYPSRTSEWRSEGFLLT